jgi:predicted flap endonuclease-1-like 5' DNA nuclease
VLEEQLMAARREMDQVRIDLDLARKESEREHDELERSKVSEMKWADELHRLREEKKELNKHMAILSGDSKAEVLLRQMKAEKDRLLHELGDQRRERQQVEDAARVLRREMNGLRNELVEAEQKLVSQGELQGRLLSAEERFRRAQVELTKSLEEQKTLEGKLDALETSSAASDETRRLLSEELSALRADQQNVIRDAVAKTRREGEEAADAIRMKVETDLQSKLDEEREKGSRSDALVNELRAELAAAKRPAKAPVKSPAKRARKSARLKVPPEEPVVKLPSRRKGAVSEDPRLGRIYRKAPAEVDDLTSLQGVGEVICQRLYDAGIYTYRQVAEWRAPQIRAISEDLKLRDRVRRNGWQKQARALHKEKYGRAP